VHINLESDYAIRIVSCLSKRSERMDAKSISLSCGVTLRFTLKILSKLIKNGIVKSYKGSKGGYMLAKKPCDITLYEVIETLEGPYVLSRCLLDPCSCERQSDNCYFYHVFDDISGMVIEKLKTVTFEI